MSKPKYPKMIQCISRLFATLRKRVWPEMSILITSVSIQPGKEEGLLLSFNVNGAVKSFVLNSADGPVSIRFQTQTPSAQTRNTTGESQNSGSSSGSFF